MELMSEILTAVFDTNSVIICRLNVRLFLLFCQSSLVAKSTDMRQQNYCITMGHKVSPRCPYTRLKELRIKIVNFNNIFAIVFK